MRWIYLSPHLDDAALSAGGLIYEQIRAGETVETWTVMAGIPDVDTLSDFAAHMHARWGTVGAPQTVELRRGEDAEAAAILGARPLHLGFLDAIYRRGPNAHALYDDPVGAAVSPHDSALPGLIVDEVRPRLMPDDRLVCLLAIGNHVDHVIVRAAAEALARPLWFIADFPYVIQHPAAAGAKTMGLEPVSESISAPALQAWTRAVHAYKSQLRAVFEEIDPAEAIREYWSATQGIRLWLSAPLGALDSAPKA